MPTLLDALSIVRLHERMLDGEKPARSKRANYPLAETWRRIEENHRYNSLLWNEEDKARRTDVPAEEIAASKRLIDRYNQSRNDAVEAIDEALLALLDQPPCPDGARLNSETAGAMTDRLSILTLKIHHMRKQTQRADADAQHVAACGAKLQRLIVQRRDLCSCFDQLLAEASSGRAYFKVYRQFKMYNDPALNPFLYDRQEKYAAGKTAP